MIGFDVFDTLLIRPCLNPTSILRLICWKIENDLGLDLFVSRKDAEGHLNNPYCTLNDIWNYVGKVNNLTEEEIAKCISIEIETETRVLYRREIGKRLFELAKCSGKRIIAISDMGCKYFFWVFTG